MTDKLKILDDPENMTYEEYDMDEGPPQNSSIDSGESPRPLITWKNRRRMAWLCLICMIVFVSVLVFDGVSVERIEVLSPIINTFLYVLGGVIIAYMGTTMLPVISAFKDKF